MCTCKLQNWKGLALQALPPYCTQLQPLSYKQWISSKDVDELLAFLFNYPWFERFSFIFSYSDALFNLKPNSHTIDNSPLQFGNYGKVCRTH